MTRIAALSNLSQPSISTSNTLNTQKRQAHWKAVDWMRPDELAIVDPLSEEPRGLDAIIEIGKLNFGQALRDCNIVVIRDDDNKVIPITETVHQYLDRFQRIQKGQHEGDVIRGLGRITWITDQYDLIWEGQIVHNELDGFARSMTFYKNGDHCSYMGFWKDGLHHGYGRVVHTSGET